jgi:hypothetical protein
MFRFILSYFIWHYSLALKDIYNLILHFLEFIYHFFSIKVLSKTLFSPWRKLDEPYKGGLNVSLFFETFVVNVIMRVVGFFMRFFIIIVGFACLLLTVLGGVASYIVWILLPFILILLTVSSIRLLF